MYTRHWECMYCLFVHTIILSAEACNFTTHAPFQHVQHLCYSVAKFCTYSKTKLARPVRSLCLCHTFAGTFRANAHIAGQGDRPEACTDAWRHRSLPQDICWWFGSESSRREHSRIFWPIWKGMWHLILFDAALYGTSFMANSLSRNAKDYEEVAIWKTVLKNVKNMEVLGEANI